MLDKQLLVDIAKSIDTDIKPEEAKIAAGIESADEATTEFVKNAIENIDSKMRTAIETYGREHASVEVDDITLELSKQALIANSAPLEALKASAKGLQVSKESDSIVIDTAPLGDIDFIPKAAIESFDAASTQPKEKFAVMLTAASAHQDEALELFFPTIPVDAFSSAASVTVRLVQLMNGFKRPVSAKGNKEGFNKIPLIKAANNPDLIDVTKNELMPIVRADVADLLVSEGARQVNVGGVEAEVAPVKFGQEINLLTVGATDALLAKGSLTDEDALDPRVQILSVVYQLTGKDSSGSSVTETFRFELEGADVTFTYSPTGHEGKSIQINQELTSVIDTTNTTTIDGSTSKILSALPQGYVAKLQYRLMGYGDTQYGNINVNLINPTLEGVYTSTGDKLSTSSSVYTSIAGVVNTFKPLGYDVRGWLTNSNARVDGLILTSDGYTAVYNFNYRTAATVKFPVVNDGDLGDANAALDVAKMVIFKINASGFKTLENFISYLKNSGDIQDLKGVANRFITKGLVNETIDLKEIVDSIESSNRKNDIASALINRIKYAANRLLYYTNYGTAINIEMPGVKPTLIVATDPVIGEYLQNITEEIGNGVFDVRFATSLNFAMKGKIIFSFGLFTKDRNVAPNPLNFGQLFRAPDLVIPVVNTQNGSTAVRTIVMPKYIHTINIPIIGVFNITGIEDVLGKVAVELEPATMQNTTTA